MTRLRLLCNNLSAGSPDASLEFFKFAQRLPVTLVDVRRYFVWPELMNRYAQRVGSGPSVVGLLYQFAARDALPAGRNKTVDEVVRGASERYLLVAAAEWAPGMAPVVSLPSRRCSLAAARARLAEVARDLMADAPNVPRGT